MVQKTGKFGVTNGRTVRCRSGRRSHARRTEGLLIQTTVGNSSIEGKQNEEESVIYSLGKQSRWLLPEVIKTNSVEFDEQESEKVILIERFTTEENKKNRRPDCFSVFNSTNGTTRESKRKLARVKDLLSETEPTNMRYEVAYPHPVRSWHIEREWNTRRKSANLGTRKKNSFLNRTITEDLDDINGPDPYYQVEEYDFSDFTECQSYPRDVNRSLTFDLGSFISSSSPKPKKSPKKKSLPLQMKDTKGKKEPEFQKGQVIFIESDDEMFDAHQEFLAQIEESSSARIQQDLYGGHRRGRGTRGRGGWRPGPGRGRGRGRGRGGYHPYSTYAEETLPLPNMPVVPEEPFTAPPELDECDDKWVFLMLSHQEITGAFLEEKWGEKYKEATCFPRTFSLNATPQSSQFNGEELFVLFRLVEDCLRHDTSKVKASVSAVVICNNENAQELVLTEFISLMQKKSTKQEIWSLEDVVNIATNCFQSNIAKGTEFTEPRKPRLSLEIFTELFGWTSETFSLNAAQQEAKKYLKEKVNHTLPENSPTAETMATSNNQQRSECGICYRQLYCEDSGTLSDTSLNTCGHKFCDDCWRAHLKTQIQLGHTDLRCPGHECAAAVDDVTLMSLLPSLYGRHLTKRLNTFLELNPEWKWCPTDQCRLVVKATTPQDPSVVSHVGIVQPVPVVCACGSMWCFKCQEDAHWPATCQEARSFREKTKGYAKMVENSRSTSLITSVKVKNCPFCHYPIEKGPGCNHMHCGLCNEEFCWYCLEKWLWDPPHICNKEKVGQREVELPASTKHLRSYEHFAVTSRMARSTNTIRTICKKLDKLDKGLQVYCTLSSEVREEDGCSGHTKKHLNRLCDNNSIHDLREVVSFKFQALLAMEGLAIVLSFTKDSPSKGLVMVFERMVFIVERMDDLLKDFNKCCSKETLERLKYLVKCGKRCLFIVSNIKK